MSAIDRFETNQRMSQVVSHNGVLYLAGQVDLELNASVAEQTQNILAKIDALLQSQGCDKTRILSASIWLKSMAGFAEFNEVWDAWVPPGQAPARACVQADLANPKFLVEIGVTAASN